MKKKTETNFEKFEKFAVKNPEKIFGGFQWEGRRESTNVIDSTNMSYSERVARGYNSIYDLPGAIKH